MGKTILPLLLITSCSLASAAAQQLTHAQPVNLPRPYTSPRVSNPPTFEKPPADWKPTAPQGFTVSAFVRLDGPRFLAVAPNGDIFVAQTEPGKVAVLHGSEGAGNTPAIDVFADRLKQPFGIAFDGNYVYIADTNQVLRFPYDPKTSKRSGEGQTIIDLPSGGMHYTRTIAFSKDNRQLFISAGSDCNVCVERDHRRAAVEVADPDGKNAHLYASGLRNAVGLGVNPQSGEVWVSVNERDMLGDNLPPDYFTHIRADGFYGWPYSYIGDHPDNRVHPQRPDMAAKATVPDVLLMPHAAPLQFQFYEASQFPTEYRHGAFLAEHGSWNRSKRSGNEVVFVAFDDRGQPTSPPKPFLTGFVPDASGASEYGRPVGIAVAPDGSLLVSDDDGGVIWRVSYPK